MSVITAIMHPLQILWSVRYATQTVTLVQQQQAQAAYLARTQTHLLLHQGLANVYQGIMHPSPILWFALYATQTAILAHQEQAQAVYLVKTLTQ